MAQPITNIVITPQHTVLFQMPNILLSPRLETDQWLNQITPTGYTFISKNSNSGEITVSQNGLDYVFSVNLIEQVGLATFVPFTVPPEPQELELRTIEIYNELAERVFLGCCPCGDEDSGSGLLQYQLGSHNNNISRRTTYTSFLGQILGQLPPDETPVLAKFHRVSILWEYYLSISANTVDMDCVAVIRKNGIDTSHSVTIPAGDTGYFQIQGINETFTSTDTFSVRLTMPDAATGAINTSAGQGSYIIVQTATSGNPFGVLEVSGEVVDNDDPSIQYPKINVFQPITREALIALIAANGIKRRVYRITDALHIVVSGIDFYSTIDVEGLDTNVISILADNHTDNDVGDYNIGTTGNNDDTFTPQGGGGGGIVDSVVAGTGILVDSTDPENPIVSQDPDFGFYHTVTLTEATALIAANGLVKGAMYKVTESTQFNNAAVYIQALEDNEFEATGTAELYFPKYNRGVAGYDIYNPAGTYTAGDIRYWGHQAWENLTGAAGTAVDIFELDGTNWALFPSTDVDWADHYDRVLYPVTYDFANNRIIEMDSMKGSKVTVGSRVVTDNLTDPVMNFPWNNDYSENDNVGISGQINGGFAALLGARGSVLMITVGAGSATVTFIQQDGAFINVFTIGDNSTVAFSQGTNSNIGSFIQGNGSSINFTQGNSSTLNSFAQGSVSSMTTFTQGNSSTFNSFVQGDYCVGNSFTQPASNTIQSVEIYASSFRDFITDVNIYKVVIQGVNDTGATDIDFTGGTVCQTTPMTITQNSTPDVIAIYYNGGTQVIGSPND